MELFRQNRITIISVMNNLYRLLLINNFYVLKHQDLIPVIIISDWINDQKMPRNKGDIWKSFTRHGNNDFYCNREPFFPKWFHLRVSKDLPITLIQK